MVVDLVGQAGLADGVATGQLFQHQALPIRVDQPGPDDLGPLLPEGNTAVIGPEQGAALRDQQITAGRAVIDVLGDMTDNLTGQIGADFRIQCSGDDGPCLKDIRGRAA